MAETEKQDKASEQQDGGQQQEPPKEAAPSGADTTSAKAPAAAPSGAGSYVVVADQLWMPGAKDGERPTTHKRGATVKLTAGQARRLAAGTRPAVVPAAAAQGVSVDQAAARSLRAAAERRSGRRSRRQA